MATHSSILAWEIPWTEEPGSYSPLGCRQSYMTEYTQLYSSTVICRNEQSSGLGGLSLAVPIPFSHAAFFQNKLPCSFQ